MKIAVYAISKNEEQFVKRFCESAKEADLILIADTGSTDGTVEVAKEAKKTKDVYSPSNTSNLFKNISSMSTKVLVGLSLITISIFLVKKGFVSQVSYSWEFQEYRKHYDDHTKRACDVCKNHYLLER